MRIKEIIRLRRIQHLAYEIIDEMNRGNEPRQLETLHLAIDNLSRVIGDLADPHGHYSLDYYKTRISWCHCRFLSSC